MHTSSGKSKVEPRRIVESAKPPNETLPTDTIDFIVYGRLLQSHWGRVSPQAATSRLNMFYAFPSSNPCVRWAITNVCETSLVVDQRESGAEYDGSCLQASAPTFS
jgi:hypothetical protein